MNQLTDKETAALAMALDAWREVACRRYVKTPLGSTVLYVRHWGVLRGIA